MSLTGAIAPTLATAVKNFQGIGESRWIHLQGSPLLMPRTTKCHPLRQTLDARQLGSAAVICAAALVCLFNSILKNFYCAIRFVCLHAIGMLKDRSLRTLVSYTDIFLHYVLPVSHLQNARCAAEQTQTVTRQSSTITIAPVQGKEKSPELDDGGTGFPPRDDDGGGGGGGGGGGHWAGGFFFFGLLAFLGLMKDQEDEGSYGKQKARY
ncbi:hypothetical protein ZIOFF_012503 [Zingiber officinale]|uniref:Uncharacterized protein n=1 Tax=Zingiber officinale TaxID=94328 RepID=A0A8J5HT48_ZINOF|nr:hypothetical protein ZIOFF_012503 [Zingiber officinale]